MRYSEIFREEIRQARIAIPDPPLDDLAGVMAAVSVDGNDNEASILADANILAEEELLVTSAPDISFIDEENRQEPIPAVSEIASIKGKNGSEPEPLMCNGLESDLAFVGGDPGSCPDSSDIGANLFPELKIEIHAFSLSSSHSPARGESMVGTAGPAFSTEEPGIMLPLNLVRIFALWFTLYSSFKLYLIKLNYLAPCNTCCPRSFGSTSWRAFISLKSTWLVVC